MSLIQFYWKITELSRKNFVNQDSEYKTITMESHEVVTF